MEHRKVPPLTPELKKQGIFDVFREFYKMETLLEKNEWYVHNYLIIRLVTIIEQFFRKVIEIQIDNKKMTPPKEITFKTNNITNLNSVSLEVVIAASYSCQSITEMKSILEKACHKCILQCVKKEDSLDILDQLFQARHNAIHTVLLPKLNLSGAYRTTETLMKCVLHQIYQSDHAFYMAQGDALDALERLNDSLESFDKAVKILPNDPYAHAGKGLAYWKAKKYAESLLCLDKAIATKPNESRFHSIKGIFLVDEKRYDDAIKCFDDAISYKVDDFFPHARKGILFVDLGRYEEASECFENAIWYSPSNSDLYNFKGDLLAKLGKHEKAIIYFDRAIALNPADVHSYLNKVHSLRELKKLDEALKYLDKAIVLDPANSELYTIKEDVQADLRGKK